MSKYYFFPKKRNKRKQKIKFLYKFLSIIIIFIVIFLLYHKAEKVNSLFKILSIQHVYLLQNSTTIPDNVIYKYIEDKKFNIFNYKKLFFHLKNLFPEIKEVKIVYILPINALKIKIYAFSPIGYKEEPNGELSFFSCEKGWYKVYDPTKIDIGRLCKIEGNIDGSFLELVYQKFNEISAWEKIRKIGMQNNKCIFYINIIDDKIVLFFLDRKIKDVKKEQLAKLVKYNFGNYKKVYAQLLSYGRVYVE